MGIFKRRYLFLINSLLIFTCVLSLWLLPEAKLLIAFSALAASMGIFILYICKKLKRITSIVGVLCCISLFLGACSSYIFFDVHIKNQEKYADKNILVKATVLSLEYSTDNMSGYIVRVHAISGEERSVSFKSRLECNYVSELKAGDTIYAEVFATQIDSDINGYDMRRNMQSRGISLTLTSNEDKDYVKTDSVKSLEVFFANLNYRCAYSLNYLISGEEGRLASALLLGNKNSLSNETQRDFSRSGVSHILALSGVHMSILMGGIAFILKNMRVRRIPRAILLIGTSVFYLALTGCSISATRSVIMLLCVYISMLVSYKSDTLTSLSVAGAAIILLSQGAVIDVGFWMSYAATLGIVTFMPLIESGFEHIFKNRKSFIWLKKLLQSSIGLVFAGLFALIGLSVVLCIFTKEYSKYSLISSVILTLPTAAVIFLSAVSPIFANVPYVGDFIVSANRQACKFMLDFCAGISKKSDTLFMFNYDFINYFAIFIAIAVIASLAIKFKKKWIAPIIPIFAIVLLICNVCAYNAIHKDDIDLTYVNISSQGDVIVLSSDNQAVLCDLSQGSYNALSTAANYALRSNVSEIKALMLTELNSYHVASTSKLFKSQRVRELWVPHPKDEDEYYVLKSLLHNAEQNDVLVKIYGNQDKLCVFGDVTVIPYIQFIERSSVPVILLDISYGDKNVVYASAAFGEALKNNEATKINNANTLIIGARGPNVKEKYRIEEGFSISEIIICDIERAIYLDTSNISNDIPIYVGKKYKNIALN